MMTFTAELVIGWLIGAAIVLAYTTIDYYLSYRGVKRDFDKLFIEYKKKVIEYNSLHDNHDLLLKQYGEMLKGAKDETK